MNDHVFSIQDYMILRAAAQKYLEKHEITLRQSTGAVRKNILESIINLDMAISRCNRRESSFPAEECGLLIHAVAFYRGILPKSSEAAHLLIPSLIQKLEALCREVREEDGICFHMEKMPAGITDSGLYQLIP